MTTTVDEIAAGIYRLSTFVPQIGPSGFTFNQFLLDDDEPLLFHTGHRAMFPDVRAAIEQVMPVDRLRWITFGHVESDECGAMNEILAVALTESDIVGPAEQAEDLFAYSSLSPSTPKTIDRLASLAPRTLALMHGSSFSGDCPAALHALADAYRHRIAAAV